MYLPLIIISCCIVSTGAGKPQSVHNCTVRNNTDGAVDVQCEPGYDGGLQQVFVLEVFAENLDSQVDGEALYRNMTDRTSPRFSLGKVALGVLYTARMYAANAKGKSTAVTLPRFSFPSSENQMGEYHHHPAYHKFFLVLESSVRVWLYIVIILILCNSQR